MKHRFILDLCGGSGAWSRPYREAGYEVLIVDPLAEGGDVRLFQVPDRPVHGILAAPPCTEFSRSGARWWPEKGERPLLEGLSVVDACLRVVFATRPKWWALENPAGRLAWFLGQPRMRFNPCDYGEPYTKKTLLWGEFNVPRLSPVPPTEGSRIHVNVRDPKKRAITPTKFTRAFFEANP